MKSISLSGSLRESVGKKDAKKSRTQGIIPCVMYGGDKEYYLTISEKELIKAIFTPETYIIKIDLKGDKQHLAIIREVQYHPVSDRILHVDFYEVFEDKPISVFIPLKYEGSAAGVLRGGVLDKKMRKIFVTGMMQDIPDIIVVDVTSVDENKSFRVEDLNFPSLKFSDNAKTIIASMMSKKKLEAKEKELETTETEATATEAETSTETAQASVENQEAK